MRQRYKAGEMSARVKKRWKVKEGRDQNKVNVIVAI